VNSSERPRYAIVVPQYGEPRFGGSASLAAGFARRLGARAEVDVLTTCADDYMTWRNAYPAGHERIDGVHVRRFAVERPRRASEFDRLSREVLAHDDPPLELQEAWMRAQGPLAPGLTEYLETFGRRYDAIAFVSYLYATTYFGLPMVEEHSVLLPLAHDEWPIRFPMWDRFFSRPRGFMFCSPGERDFVRARFPDLGIDGPVAGVGVEPPADVQAERFRERYGISGPFILYLGRVDPAKGCDALAENFGTYRRGGGRFGTLVFVGETHMRVEGSGIVTTGPVDETTKWDALAACDLLVMPSRYESLSMATLEAWSLSKPVLVRAQAQVVVEQCRRSGGGLWYANGDEFSAALDLMDAPTRAALGRQGRRFVGEFYTWPRAVDVFAQHLDRIAREYAAERRGSDAALEEAGPRPDARGWYDDGWAAAKMHFVLPPPRSRFVELDVALPPESPLERQTISVENDGVVIASETFGKGEFTIPIAPPRMTWNKPLNVTIYAQRSFLPPACADGPRDRRKLSYILRRLEYAER
jgi:glycosyltransferase involved in cell wall biosynthesis